MIELLLIAVLLATQTGNRPLARIPALTAPRPLATANFSIAASPSSISFTGADPDSPTDAGSATTTVSWSVANSASDPWKLQVSAPSSTLTNCSTVPVSAITVTCTAGFNPGSGGFNCSAPITLSTSAQTVASGTVPGAGYTYFWVTLTYTLTDSWKYIAHTSPTCTLNMTYLATVN